MGLRGLVNDPTMWSTPQFLSLCLPTLSMCFKLQGCLMVTRWLLKIQPSWSSSRQEKGRRKEEQKTLVRCFLLTPNTILLKCKREGEIWKKVTCHKNHNLSCLRMGWGEGAGRKDKQTSGWGLEGWGGWGCGKKKGCCRASITKAFDFSREARNVDFYVKYQRMYILNVGDSENNSGFNQSMAAHRVHRCVTSGVRGWGTY